MDIKLGDLEPHEVAQLTPMRPIYVAYRGSHAHGTYTPPSDPQAIDDIDILVIYIPGLEKYFGTETASRGRQMQFKQWDSAAYELRHFCALAANCNPDVMQSLWVRKEDIIYMSPEGASLRANRDMFSSKLVHNTFGGYAHGQLKRMTAYHDHGEDRCCPGETWHTAECMLRQERGRGTQKKFATGYMGMKRKALVEKFGYDTKNAAHCIRLLRMGTEFLLTGQVNVYRDDDREQLMAIKRGDFTLEEIIAMANTNKLALDDALAKSPLPDQPDRAAIEALLIETLCVAKTSDVTLIATRVMEGRWGK
jgi:predicted nucleotidyltransferase